MDIETNTVLDPLPYLWMVGVNIVGQHTQGTVALDFNELRQNRFEKLVEAVDATTVRSSIERMTAAPTSGSPNHMGVMSFGKSGLT